MITKNYVWKASNQVPRHPGEMIVALMVCHELTQEDVARGTGLSLDFVRRLTNKNASVDSETALCISNFFRDQLSAEELLNIQKKYDEATR